MFHHKLKSLMITWLFHSADVFFCLSILLTNLQNKNSLTIILIFVFLSCRFYFLLVIYCTASSPFTFLSEFQELIIIQNKIEGDAFSHENYNYCPFGISDIKSVMFFRWYQGIKIKQNNKIKKLR